MTQLLSALQIAEKQVIEDTMIILKGNQSEAARLLQISRTTLRNKLRVYFGERFFRLTQENKAHLRRQYQEYVNAVESNGSPF